MEKVKVAFLCGGRSAEHEVSLQSVKNIASAADPAQYEKTLIGITKDGRWLWRERQDGADFGGFLLNGENPKTICLDEKNLVPFECGRLKSLFDVVFPVLHGPFGEDGTVQGLLKMSGVPFVGSGVLGSALAMDKETSKKLLRAEGVPIAGFVTLRKDGGIPDFSAITAKLGLPLFVKPANMGSSVGVHKVHGEDEWLNAVNDAFFYDDKVIVEEFIEGREVECAVLGNGAGAKASCAGEIIASHEFYSYNAKYIDENGARIEIPAKLPDDVTEKIRETAVKVFLILNCADLSRVDFFVKKDGNIIVNEINTMPGFTKISMYPKLWEQSGVSYETLVDRLIRYGLGYMFNRR
ncbi:MAG: D-alanine--D-alanine ligase [Spirochaetaceae bacterium]|jgi:D-alanine-D-alanine ligase|nr:D-alanine--D-alanine ligase [Spirochaetaceae bacterium]